VALNDSSFITNLQAAFQVDTWYECATKMASAIQSYIQSGSVITSVAITITLPTPPGGTTPGTVSGINGIITAPSTASLESQLYSAFQQTDWNTVYSIISNAINTYFKQCTVAITQYISPTVGTGSSTLIASDPGLSALSSSIQTAFMQDNWTTVVSNIQSAIKTFITQTNIIKTIDSGTVPVQSWTNTISTNGQGTIS
jgi:hypothetical protein